MASTLSTVHCVPWAGDGGFKKAAKITLRNRKSREKRVNRGPYMVDANRYCFANPSITKRRTERVRRFKRVRHDCYDSRAAEEIRREITLARVSDVMGVGGPC